MMDFEKSYYFLISKISDVLEYLECIENKDSAFADTEQQLRNLIENADIAFIEGTTP